MQVGVGPPEAVEAGMDEDRAAGEVMAGEGVASMAAACPGDVDPDRRQVESRSGGRPARSTPSAYRWNGLSSRCPCCRRT